MKGFKEKRERSLGEHLHLKATRCASPKCALVRRPYRPGVHGKGKHLGTLSDFGRQLIEKQKVKAIYAISERNLRQLFKKAVQLRGSTAEAILDLLERRLDNVLYRMGIAASRSVARQLVVHGHIAVNGNRVKSPGFLVRTGDVVSIRRESRRYSFIRTIKEAAKTHEVPHWLSFDPENLEGRVISTSSDTNPPFELSYVVESFSK